MTTPATLELMIVAVRVAYGPEMSNAPFSHGTAQLLVQEMLSAARVAGFKQVDICLSALAAGHAETSARLLTAACAMVTQDAVVAALGRAGLRAHRVH